MQDADSNADAIDIQSLKGASASAMENAVASDTVNGNTHDVSCHDEIYVWVQGTMKFSRNDDDRTYQEKT